MKSIFRRGMLKYILRNQDSFMVLDIHKYSPVKQITFLQSNLQILPNALRSTINDAKLKTTSILYINTYINQIEKLSDKLTNIQSRQFNSSILKDKDVLSISKTFQGVKNCLNQQIKQILSQKTQRAKIKYVIYFVSALNILQHKIWSEIIMIINKQYKSYSTQDKYEIMQMLITYLTKYSYISTDKMSHHKFVMKQTHLRDLFDFDYFLLKTQQIQLMKKLLNTQLRNAINLIKCRIQLINKVGRSLNVNYYAVRKQFESYLPELASNIQFCKMQDILFFYSFYLKTSGKPKDFYQKIQSQIYKNIRERAFDQKFQIRIALTLITLWSYEQRYDKSVYDTFVSPVIMDALKNNDRIINNWVNLAYRLLCCGLEQENLLKDIIVKLQSNQQDGRKKNVTLTIVNSYFRLKKLKSEKKMKDIIQQRIKQVQRFINMRKSHKQAIQFSPSEDFWAKIIKQFVPEENVHQCVYIQSYQLDLLVLYKGCYFAVQVQGSYKQSDENRKLKGKERIKDQIINSYGISTIRIKCQQMQPKILMRFNLANGAKEYMQRLLEKAYSQKKSYEKLPILNNK